MRINSHLGVLLILLLAACQTQAARTAAVPLVQARLTPALRPLTAQLRQCAQQAGPAGLVVVERPAGAPSAGTGWISLRLGVPVELRQSSYRLGEERLAVILNPQRKSAALSVDALAGIYAGRITDWKQATGESEAKPIHAWTYLPGDDARQVFEQAFPAGGLRSLWLAPDPSAMLEAVAADPDAVGYVPAHWLDGSVNEATPGRAPAALTAPVLALVDSAPSAAVQALLACMQEEAH